MDLSLFQDILILLGFSVIIVFLLQRIKLPSILGFLVTGIIIGPHGLSLVTEVDQVETISQIGVILLLFVIGMELSLKQLASMRKTVFIGGLLQVGLMVLLTAVIYHFFGVSWSQAVFMGFLFSLSSTAIVLKILQDRNEMGEMHGRNALAMLIFQDIIVVPMMLVTPIMAGNSTNITYSILSLLIKSIIVLAITYVLARYIIPKVMYYIAKTRNKELFLITTITICFAIADLTALAGLSLALGAFLAGLVISESEFSHQATSIILPFRELFTSFFFISVGMLMNLGFFFEHISTILLLVMALFVVKSGATALAVGLLKYPPKTILLTAFSLFQVGEFAFIMAGVGEENGLLDADTSQYFLAVSICSMLLTPFVLMFSDPLADGILKLFFGKKIQRKKQSLREKLRTEEDLSILENHLIIVGFGVNGRGLAKAAGLCDIPYVVLETNAVTVEKETKNGIPILFGDAAESHILNQVNIYQARAIVVAVSNFETSKNIIKTVRNITHSVHLLVRTRYVKEMEELNDLGANEVVPEELEASVEIFSRILHNFLVPEDEIIDFIEKVRADNYKILQENKPPKTFKSKQIPDFDITSLRVYRDSGAPVGKSLKDLDLRAQYGVNVIAISRKGSMLSNIHAEEKILQNDILYVQGDVQHIEYFRKAIN